MNDKRLKQVHTTLAFLRSVIMSGEPMTNEVRNSIDDAIYNLRDADKDIKKQLLILYIVVTRFNVITTHCIWNGFFAVLYTVLTTVILRVGILRSKTLTLFIKQMLCIQYICCIFEYRKELTTITKPKKMTTTQKIKDLNERADKATVKAELFEKRGQNVKAMNQWREVERLVFMIETLEF